MSSTLLKEHQNEDNLLGICCSFGHPSLYKVEQVLDWVQPWAILCIVEDVDFELAACLFDLGVVMELHIVHEQNDFPLSQVSIRTNVCEHLVEHLLEECSIECTLNNLTAEQSILGDSCNERH